MAIEDAVVLGECLAAGHDAEGALRRYEQLRRPRASMIQAQSRRNKLLYHLRTPTGFFRDLGAPVLSLWLSRVTSEIFGYDAQHL
jgi:salicylate hydroxylase